jgi:hypothetical protein
VGRAGIRLEGVESQTMQLGKGLKLYYTIDRGGLIHIL